MISDAINDGKKGEIVRVREKKAVTQLLYQLKLKASKQLIKRVENKNIPNAFEYNTNYMHTHMYFLQIIDRSQKLQSSEYSNYSNLFMIYIYLYSKIAFPNRNTQMHIDIFVQPLADKIKN